MFIKSPELFHSSAKNCSGICMENRIATYCDAIHDVGSTCMSGFRCCVTKETFDTIPPSELLIIDRDKANLTRVVQSSIGTSSSTSSMTSVTHQQQHHKPASTATTTTTQKPKPKPAPEPPAKPCKGECVSPFFALICENVDTEADCGDSGYCCIRDPPKQQPPPKVKETSSTKRKLRSRMMRLCVRIRKSSGCLQNAYI